VPSLQSATAAPRPVVAVEPAVVRVTATVVAVRATVVLVVVLVVTVVLLLVVVVGAVFASPPPQPPARTIRKVQTMQANWRTIVIAGSLPQSSGG
jgi:hypothetical protein